MIFLFLYIFNICITLCIDHVIEKTEGQDLLDELFEDHGGSVYDLSGTFVGVSKINFEYTPIVKNSVELIKNKELLHYCKYVGLYVDYWGALFGCNIVGTMSLPFKDENASIKPFHMYRTPLLVEQDKKVKLPYGVDYSYFGINIFLGANVLIMHNLYVGTTFNMFNLSLKPLVLGSFFDKTEGVIEFTDSVNIDKYIGSFILNNIALQSMSSGVEISLRTNNTSNISYVDTGFYFKYYPKQFAFCRLSYNYTTIVKFSDDVDRHAAIIHLASIDYYYKNTISSIGINITVPAGGNIFVSGIIDLSILNFYESKLEQQGLFDNNLREEFTNIATITPQGATSPCSEPSNIIPIYTDEIVPIKFKIYSLNIKIILGYSC